MNIQERLITIRNKIASIRACRELADKFKSYNIIPPELLTDYVLKKVVMNFIRRAEKNGWTAGIDLDEEQISEYLMRIIKGERVNYKQAGKVNQVIDLIRKSTFSD